MTRLALASLRHRMTSFTATYVTILLGTALIGAFGAVAETGTGPVSDPMRRRSSPWAQSSAAGEH